MNTPLVAGPTTPVPDLADVLALTEEVWASFLGDDLPLLPTTDRADRPDLSATVSVTGSWHGLVSLGFTAAAASEVARRMLQLPAAGPAAEEDVADAVGELVNMVGGNVKSLMPGPSALSLPVVSTGRLATPTGTAQACRADLSWGGWPVSVSVHVAGTTPSEEDGRC